MLCVTRRQTVTTWSGGKSFRNLIRRQLTIDIYQADPYALSMSTTLTKPRGQKRPAPSTVSTALRQAMIDSGLSAYKLARDSGVNVAAVLRFRSGERSLKLESVDKLAEVLRLELRPVVKG